MNARRANDTRDDARKLQRALYRAAKASPARRFHALYDKMYREDVLAKAWREVKANAGSAGVDGQTIEQIEQQGVSRDSWSSWQPSCVRDATGRKRCDGCAYPSQTEASAG